MKTVFINPQKFKDIEIAEQLIDEEFFKLMSEYKILESHIIYFSAGESKIKEILVKKEPTYAAKTR
ncbi:MAG: hypothetical protein KBA61_12110 [Spirochaetes bacterium]|nr:hypothetical protein [Spirochaetota bacterium]HPA72340.1 hypothetical protein [Spirochaetota bacterium]